jgi:hypothetical protein
VSIPLAADPRWPLLSAVLLVSAVAAATRATCHYAVLLALQRPELARAVHGWQAAAFGLASAWLVLDGMWQAGAAFGVLAGYRAVTWGRERKNGKRAAREKEYAR